MALEKTSIYNSELENSRPKKDVIKPVDIVFLGTMGTGKSTFVSNLSGQQFESGVSFGKGKIPEFEFKDDIKGRPIRWSDTAGLCDPVQAEQAAKLIHNALVRAKQDCRELQGRPEFMLSVEIQTKISPFYLFFFFFSFFSFER